MSAKPECNGKASTRAHSLKDQSEDLCQVSMSLLGNQTLASLFRGVVIQRFIKRSSTLHGLVDDRFISALLSGQAEEIDMYVARSSSSIPTINSMTTGCSRVSGGSESQISAYEITSLAEA